MNSPKQYRHYMKLWARVTRLVLFAYNFGKRNGSMSGIIDGQTQDLTTTGATETGTPPPVAANAAAPTLCFAHSEPFCYCCCSKPGGAY